MLEGAEITRDNWRYQSPHPEANDTQRWSPRLVGWLHPQRSSKERGQVQRGGVRGVGVDGHLVSRELIRVFSSAVIERGLRPGVKYLLRECCGVGGGGVRVWPGRRWLAAPACRVGGFGVGQPALAVSSPAGSLFTSSVWRGLVSESADM